MSAELVTGYFGVDSGGKPKRHVSSAEDGARQAGTVGLGCYALSTGSKLSATMEDANTLLVADGDVMMNGRHVSLPDPTSFTIPTGVQGQKVSNIAVLRYQKSADSVESVTPVVLTGEPSTGEPTDPAHNEGSILDGDSPVDMPLYRIVTDGINAEGPVPLFSVMMPMSDLWNSVSRRLDDGGGSLGVWIQTCGNVGLIAINVRGTFSSSSYTKIASLPKEIADRLFLPSGSQYAAILGFNSTKGVVEAVSCNVDKSGDISIRPAASTNSAFGSFVIMLT